MKEQDDFPARSYFAELIWMLREEFDEARKYFDEPRVCWLTFYDVPNNDPTNLCDPSSLLCGHGIGPAIQTELNGTSSTVFFRMLGGNIEARRRFATLAGRGKSLLFRRPMGSRSYTFRFEDGQRIEVNPTILDDVLPRGFCTWSMHGPAQPEWYFWMVAAAILRRSVEYPSLGLEHYSWGLNEPDKPCDPFRYQPTGVEGVLPLFLDEAHELIHQTDVSLPLPRAFAGPAFRMWAFTRNAWHVSVAACDAILKILECNKSELATATSPAQPAKEASEQAANKQRQVKWEQVRSNLITMCEKGQAFTTYRDLAGQLGVSLSTIKKAIHESDHLKGWAGVDQGVKNKTPPKHYRLSDADRDGIAQGSEADPADKIEDDEIMARLIKEVPSAQREATKAALERTTPEKRRELAEWSENNPANR